MARSRRNPGWMKSGDVADFMPTPIETPEVKEEECWDGTIDHLKKLARLAANRVNINITRIQSEKHDLALAGITMAIAEDPNTPISVLLQRGQEEASRAAQKHLQEIGQRNDQGTGGRFAAYWNGDRGVHHDPPWLEKYALNQIWEHLDAKHQDVIVGKVAYPQNKDHAEALGLSRPAVSKRLKKARTAAFELWFGHETPPPLPVDSGQRMTTHCGNGHDLDVHGSWMTRTGRGRVRYCLECARENNQRQKGNREA